MPNDQLSTLITQTPEEGYALAVRLAQKGVGVTQPFLEDQKTIAPGIFQRCE